MPRRALLRLVARPHGARRSTAECVGSTALLPAPTQTNAFRPPSRRRASDRTPTAHAYGPRSCRRAQCALGAQVDAHRRRWSRPSAVTSARGMLARCAPRAVVACHACALRAAHQRNSSFSALRSATARRGSSACASWTTLWSVPLYTCGSTGRNQPQPCAADYYEQCYWCAQSAVGANAQWVDPQEGMGCNQSCAQLPRQAGGRGPDGGPSLPGTLTSHSSVRACRYSHCRHSYSHYRVRGCRAHTHAHVQAGGVLPPGLAAQARSRT